MIITQNKVPDTHSIPNFGEEPQVKVEAPLAQREQFHSMYVKAKMQ